MSAALGSGKGWGDDAAAVVDDDGWIGGAVDLDAGDLIRYFFFWRRGRGGCAN